MDFISYAIYRKIISMKYALDGIVHGSISSDVMLL